MLMNRYGQSSPSPANPLHSDTAPVKDTWSQMTPHHASPLNETSHPDTSVPAPVPRRRPLPAIPVPPYYAASQPSELTSDESKDVEGLYGRRVRPKTQETAPPQYER
jgi:hypothetical protein